MEISFTDIRNRIRDHKKYDLLQACFNILDNKKYKIKPVWDIFILIKWTYLYGEENYPSKPLTKEKLSFILNSIAKFNDEHTIGFMKNGQVDRAFHVLFSQQFYLQETVFKEKFATQLKLYNSLYHKYSIDNSFREKTLVISSG